MALIQAMRRLADVGQSGPACPAAHCPARRTMRLGIVYIVTAERDMACP